MEIAFEKKTKIKPLTVSHFEHLFHYCMIAEEDGGYYGNEKHYWKRHNEIKAWIQDCINTLRK